MKKLVLGKIPKDFSFETHHPLGPWCFLDVEDQVPDWDEFSFSPDGFTNSEEYQSADRVCEQILLEVLPFFSDHLNKANNLDKGQDFWRIVAGPYLSLAIQNIYERRERVLKFIEKNKNDQFEVDLVEYKDKRILFNDFLQFTVKGVNNCELDPWWFSYILSIYGPSSWKYNQINFSWEVKAVTDRGQRNIKSDILNILRRFLRLKGIYGIGILWSFILSFYLAFRKSKPQKLKPLRSLAKSEYDFESDPLDWKMLLLRTLPLELENVSSDMETPLPIKKGAIFACGSRLYFNQETKVEAARYFERGIQQYFTQHGGSYGLLETYTQVYQFEYGFQPYLSWGWRNQGNYEVDTIPVPSPYLSQKKKELQQRTKDLPPIFIGTYILGSNHRLVTFTQPVSSIEYRKSKIKFLKNLSPSIREDLLYRPYHAITGMMQDEAYVKRHYPDLNICKGDLHQQIFRSKLVIMDNLGTTLNISLAGNLPTIVFFDPKEVCVGEPASPFFKDLRDVGILHDTAESAAQFMNKIYQDIDGWWLSQDVQAAKDKWVNQFARSSESWQKEWIEIIKNI